LLAKEAREILREHSSDLLFNHSMRVHLFAAEQGLSAHHLPEEHVQTVWEAIALHTTPGITQYLRPEIALLYSGVSLDVIGRGFDRFPSELRHEIVARYPRIRFKDRVLQEYQGFAHKPATTIGTVNAGVCERFIPGYKNSKRLRVDCRISVSRIPHRN
jgi:hypothetical protein